MGCEPRGRNAWEGLYCHLCGSPGVLSEGLMEQSRGKGCSRGYRQVQGWKKSRVGPMNVRKCDVS